MSGKGDTPKHNSQFGEEIIALLTPAMAEPPVGLVLIELRVETETGTEIPHDKDLGDELRSRIGRCLDENDLLLAAGQDRLLVIKRDLRAPAETEGFALRLLNALGGPVRIGNRSGTCQSAIGVAVSHPDDTPAELLRYAEYALEDAGMLGGDMVVCFEDADRELLSER